MSNHAHRARQRSRRRQMSADQVDHAVAVALELAGCTCTPDITTRHEHTGQHLTVSHDHDCPARTAPSLHALDLRRHRP